MYTHYLHELQQYFQFELQLIIYVNVEQLVINDTLVYYIR